MTGEEGEQKKEAKGFAALSTLVSKVDTPTPSVSKTGPASDAPDTRRPLPLGAQEHHGPAAPPKSGSTAGIWVLGIVCVVILALLIGQMDKGSAPRPAAHPLSAQPSYGPSSPERSAPPLPQEAVPPVGQDLVLSTAQIRYCLAEDIRIEGARSTVNNYVDSDVDRFNSMVDDYNSRCGSFRYRRGALESARREVEANRSQLQAEGRNRFSSASVPSARGSLAEQRPERIVADPTVQAIQRKLNEIGYSAGAADGLMGPSTRSAIREFQRASGLAVDGNASADLLQVLLMTAQAEIPVEQSPSASVSVAPLRSAPSLRAPSRQGSTGSQSAGIPRNAHLNYLGNGWECDRGYFKQGNQCSVVQVPQNGKLNYLGNGWECDRGYFRQGDQCSAVQVPRNGKLNYLGNGWECDRGYFRYGDQCSAVQIPRNGKLNYLGNGWECDRGYFRQGNQCSLVQIPQNGKLNYLGNGWECNPGFRRSGSQCVPIN